MSGQDSIMAEILTLLNQVWKPPEQGGPVGAGVAQLIALRDSLGFDLPRELQYWLVQCNCLIAGDGHGNTYVLDVGR
ncbi:hypothetical protein [Saccharothrix sp. NRRL B-16348]|uniref:hypothetical protein n=1 Tax=Saccharothrix sp. NRRL B-16348 TaxID=1415542 RepID=UPI0012FC182D|nr:hypothetical protein [Saccharothrix sp. NRRL B-16348]